ncbi:hypothetical protein FM112_07705 [Gulosibacter sp. 10]|nr:hypothetical protein FM112_07705 [Gulosibacter sp. 10]
MQRRPSVFRMLQQLRDCCAGRKNDAGNSRSCRPSGPPGRSPAWFRQHRDSTAVPQSEARLQSGCRPFGLHLAHDAGHRNLDPRRPRARRRSARGRRERPA